MVYVVDCNDLTESKGRRKKMGMKTTKEDFSQVSEEIRSHRCVSVCVCSGVIQIWISLLA